MQYVKSLINKLSPMFPLPNNKPINFFSQRLSSNDTLTGFHFPLHRLFQVVFTTNITHTFCSVNPSYRTPIVVTLQISFAYVVFLRG